MQDTKYDVVINGRVLLKPLNGIPRYVYEIVKNIDQLDLNGLKICLVIPETEKDVIKLNNIDVIKVPMKRNFDFSVVEKIAKKSNALYINMASNGILYKNSIVCIHDVRPILKNFKESLVSKLKFFLSFKMATKNAGTIVTVSNTAKKEIISLSKRKDIEVIGCGWEHYKIIEPDTSIFEKYPELIKKKYIITVSSIAPHKNFSWIMKNALINEDYIYVVCGGADPKLWKTQLNDYPKNVLYLGFVSDEVLKALILNASYMVFPTLYEGFGLPPLEALSCGVNAIVSDIEVLKEIYGDSVLYLNPNDASLNISSIDSKIKQESINKVLETNSWKLFSKKWLDIIKNKLNK